jgi:hypothetical protein
MVSIMHVSFWAQMLMHLKSFSCTKSASGQSSSSIWYLNHSFFSTHIHFQLLVFDVYTKTDHECVDE